MPLDSGFLYLNISNLWPNFDRHGIVIASDGALQLDQTGGQFVSRGVLLAGPFQASNTNNDWFRLRAIAEELPDGAHAQFFTLTTNGGPPPFDPTALEPFVDPPWSPLPRDLWEGVITSGSASSLWIGLILRSAGDASPRIHQLRADYGRDTYLTWMPALYGLDPGREFLERFLAHYSAILGPVEDEIGGMTRLFDAYASPENGFPSWLEWLAGWLAFDLKEDWTSDQKRKYLSEAFELYKWRGTIEGLRRYLKIYAGVNARILEAGQFAQMWSLGALSTLGAATRLLPGAYEGAVIGSTAIVDQARVSLEGDRGASLYEDVAHVFCVQVHCSELAQPGALETVRQILDQEKPAHTVYQLSVIEPMMRIGAQAQIGIDTVIAAGTPPAQIGMPLGGRALGEQALPCDNPGGLDL